MCTIVQSRTVQLVWSRTDSSEFAGPLLFEQAVSPPHIANLRLLLHHRLYSALKSISTFCQCTQWWAIKSLVAQWLLNLYWCIFTQIFYHPRANHTLNYRSISLVVVDLLASQAHLHLVKYFSTSGNPVFARTTSVATPYPLPIFTFFISPLPPHNIKQTLIKIPSIFTITHKNNTFRSKNIAGWQWTWH